VCRQVTEYGWVGSQQLITLDAIRRCQLRKHYASPKYLLPTWVGKRNSCT
jgi:hypothetical protein